MTADQMKKYAARVRRQRRISRLALIALLGLLVFLMMDRNFKPLVFSLAEARSAAMASQVLSGALAEALEEGVSYEELVDVRMDERGQVALLSANTMRMNRLADRAGAAALRRLQNMSSERVTVPLGAVLVGFWVAGNVIFVLYDVALTRALSLYFVRFQPQIHRIFR